MIIPFTVYIPFGPLLFQALWSSLFVLAQDSTSTTTTTYYEPLTTRLSFPKECSSLTLMHYSSEVSLFQGCIGWDESCCPEFSKTTDFAVSRTWSPGICPMGYVATGLRSGLDKLATDTLETIATCVQSGYTKCEPGPYAIPNPFGTTCGGHGNRYSSPLPPLTTPLTVVVIHYEFEDVSLGYPFRPAARTTTVFSESIPSTLWAATRGIESVVMQEFVIRWRKEDVEKGILPEDPAGAEEEGGDDETSTDSRTEEDDRTTTGSESDESGIETTMEKTSTESGAQQPSGNPEGGQEGTTLPSTNQKSTTLRNALIAVGVVFFLFVVGVSWYFIRRYRLQRKARLDPVPTNHYYAQTPELGGQQRGYEIGGTQIPMELASGR